MQRQMERERQTLDVEIERGVDERWRRDSRKLALKLKKRGAYAAFCRDVLASWNIVGMAIVLGALVGVPSGLIWMANSEHTGCRTRDSLCYELRYAGHWVGWQLEKWF